MTAPELGLWDCAGQDEIPVKDATSGPATHCRCGRPIWDAESVARGMGPVCWVRVHGHGSGVRERRREVHPGQALIDVAVVPGDDYSI